MHPHRALQDIPATSHPPSRRTGTRHAARAASTLALLAAAAIGRGASAAPSVEIFPLDDVRPGMHGTGRTVFQGDATEDFDVEILGVLKNALSPRRDIIFVRLHGEKVEYTGVAAGMSGSPVYVDGKLLGALSYRFGMFSKEPLGGVTPMSYMMAIDGGAQGAPSTVPGGVPLSDPAQPEPPRASSVSWARGFDEFVRTRRDRPYDPALAILASTPAAAVAASMQPIATPLALSGFRNDGAMTEAFAKLGFAPVQGGAAASAPASGSGGSLVLSGGSAVSVQLIRGDMDMAATGTVTCVDGDRVYAFGHQFFNFGRISLPMSRASVITVLPSPAGSYKVTTVGDTVGSFNQDRMAGIFGRLGTSSAMVPVEVDFADGAGLPVHYAYEIAADPVLAPVLLNYSLQNVFSAADKDFGEKTLRVNGAISIEGAAPVAVENLFSGTTAYQFASGYVSAFLGFIYGNQFSLPKVSAIKLQILATDDVRTAEVTEVVPSRYRVSPGDTLELEVGLRPRRGADLVLPFTLKVPADALPGKTTLFIGDGTTLAKLQSAAAPSEPQSMDDVISRLNGMRRDNTLYAALSSQEDGLSINGQALAGMPGSFQAILAVDQGSGKAPIQGVPLTEAAVDTDYTITGSRQITVEIAAPRS
ncbi:MAG: SpoIVB peptidase S55 domain-containing protein [Acidobacteriota bacterium]